MWGSKMWCEVHLSIGKLVNCLKNRNTRLVGRLLGVPDGAGVHAKGKLKPLGVPHWFAIRNHTYDCRVYEMRDPRTGTRQ
jgi:hypothetical protein